LNPIAFSIFGFAVRWYGIMIATGMISGILVAYYTCKMKRLDYDTFTNIILIAIPAGIIGARLYYVLFNLGYYMSNPSEILNIREGGLAIHGGLLFGILGAGIYMYKKRLNFLDYADAAAPSIILAQAIGRWGNFFNQEAHGGPVSYEFIKHFPMFIQKGMFIDNIYYHPTFLYESSWNIVVFIVLLLMLRKGFKSGTIFFTYLGLYSIGRYFIEGLRTDSLMFGPFRIAQLVSLTGVLLWIGFIIIKYVRDKRRI
jgi:phosphatidylglycerol:prolipoprotein diacylglycerol transferase